MLVHNVQICNPNRCVRGSLCVGWPRSGRHGAVRQRNVSGAVQSYPGPSHSEEESLVQMEQLVPNKRYATYDEALFNCVNILLGCGILTIPYALKEGGWSALGVLGLLWLSTNYTGKVLIQCQEYFARFPMRKPAPNSSIDLKDGLMQSYEDIAEAAFGKAGREVMTAVLYTELLGTCALFLILQKDHMRLLMDAMPTFPEIPDAALLALALAIVLPTTWLPDLSALSRIGRAGFFSAVAVTGILVYTYATSVVAAGGQPIPAPTAALHLSTLPMTFGLLAFVFAGHAVFPAIYGSMEPAERPEFPKLLDQTYLIVLAVCATIGVVGYAAFGDGTLEELNLPVGGLSVLATLLVLVSPFAKFALTLEPVAQGAERALKITPGTPFAPVATRVVRTGLAGFSLFLAAKVPFFGIFMALLGSFLTLMVSVIFPCMAHLKLSWGELSVRERGLDVGIISLGVFATIAGTCTAVEDLLGDAPGDVAMVAMHFSSDSAVVLHHLVCKSVCYMT